MISRKPLISKWGAAALAGAAFLGLSACSTYDDYGYGGSRYSVGVGYGSYPYYGWYDDFYYPGAGYYVYDRAGRRHAWNDRQRRYWEGRRGNRPGRENWNGYRGGVSREAWQQRREAWRAERRQQQGTSAPAWRERRESAQQQRRENAQPRQQGGTGIRGALERSRRN